MTTTFKQMEKVYTRLSEAMSLMIATTNMT